MTKIYRWGIIGCGKIAAKFAQDLRHVPNAQLYAVASRSSDNATAFAAKFDAGTAYDSYEKLVRDPKVDVVYIATPHTYHYEHTLLCLKHNKAVLCEKPFAMNEKQVQEMIATAKEQSCFLMEAFWTYFLPHFTEVEKFVQSGAYGTIRRMEANFGFKADPNPEGRLFNKALGGGSLLDIGIYPLFLSLVFLGMPETVEATAQISDTGVDKRCDMLLTYPGGVQAKLYSTLVEETDSTAEIFMENGSVRMNTRFHEPTKLTYTTPDTIRTVPNSVDSIGYNFEAVHVQHMLNEGRTESTIMTFEKSLQLIQLLDRVRECIGLEYEGNTGA